MAAVHPRRPSAVPSRSRNEAYDAGLVEEPRERREVREAATGLRAWPPARRRAATGRVGRRAVAARAAHAAAGPRGRAARSPPRRTRRRDPSPARGPRPRHVARPIPGRPCRRRSAGASSGRGSGRSRPTALRAILPIAAAARQDPPPAGLRPAHAIGIGGPTDLARLGPVEHVLGVGRGRRRSSQALKRLAALDVPCADPRLDRLGGGIEEDRQPGGLVGAEPAEDVVHGAAPGLADAHPEAAELLAAELADDRAQPVVAAVRPGLAEAELAEREREVVRDDEQVDERDVVALRARRRTARPESFMYVCGLASTSSWPPARISSTDDASRSRPRPAFPARSATRSSTIQARLWRVSAYWLPGFPRPTTSFTSGQHPQCAAPLRGLRGHGERPRDRVRRGSLAMVSRALPDQTPTGSRTTIAVSRDRCAALASV